MDVRTVDGFQGQERDVIIFSAVRCNKEGQIGFLGDRHRMNVLLTRAKRGLIVIGSRLTLGTDALWCDWMNHMEERGLLVNTGMRSLVQIEL